MIRGQQIFKEYFKDFTDCYVIIGGLAVGAHMDDQGIPFRATKDFDIILLVEALSPEFFEKFWSFVQAGEYERKETSTGPRKYYRFIKPKNEEYPFQLELFARRPDMIPVIEDHHLVPIPSEEDISSLSAILMDDHYYNLTKESAAEIEGMHIASKKALICLKAKAYLDLRKRKEEGQNIDSKEIKKHKNDIFRIAVTLTGEEQFEVPDTILEDLSQFVNILEKEESDIKQLLKSMNISGFKDTDLLDLIRKIYSIL